MSACPESKTDCDTVSWQPQPWEPCQLAPGNINSAATQSSKLTFYNNTDFDTVSWQPQPWEPCQLAPGNIDLAAVQSRNWNFTHLMIMILSADSSSSGNCQLAPGNIALLTAIQSSRLKFCIGTYQWYCQLAATANWGSCHLAPGNIASIQSSRLKIYIGTD